MEAEQQAHPVQKVNDSYLGISMDNPIELVNKSDALIEYRRRAKSSDRTLFAKKPNQDFDKMTK
jgi:hypothetical protein